MYIPKPIDTTQVDLPEEINELAEKLAENAHENWAALRLKEGWVYGDARDDILMKHPWLIPYDELPESEKVYDRVLAMENIKVILSLGYHITK